MRARDYALAPLNVAQDMVPYLIAASDEEPGFRTIGWPQRQEEISLYLNVWMGSSKAVFTESDGAVNFPSNSWKC
jgi:hypothetical protein